MPPAARMMASAIALFCNHRAVAAIATVPENDRQQGDQVATDGSTIAREGSRPGSRELQQPFSLYLDTARFLAAGVVFIGHLGTQRMTAGWLWQASGYVHVALMAFFVLSGYVVAHVVDTREHRAGAYAASRLARLYSVVLPALLLTLLADAIGAAASPERYPARSGQHDDGLSYLAGALFLHQSWDWNVFPGSNMPYWSLGPEAMFYLAFGLSWFSRSIWPGLIAIALAGPTIAFLFPLWLLGVAVYHLRPRLPEGAAWLLFAATLAALLADPALRRLTQDLTIPLVRRPQPIADYLGGIAFALHLLAAASLAHRLRWLVAHARLIRWCGSLTFALYLFHYPVAYALASLFPSGEGSVLRYLVVCGGTFLVVATLGRWCEACKGGLRRSILTLPGFRA